MEETVKIIPKGKQKEIMKISEKAMKIAAKLGDGLAKTSLLDEHIDGNYSFKENDFLVSYRRQLYPTKPGDISPVIKDTIEVFFKHDLVFYSREHRYTAYPKISHHVRDFKLIKMAKWMQEFNEFYKRALHKN
jgi:hypothetical protein